MRGRGRSACNGTSDIQSAADEATVSSEPTIFGAKTRLSPAWRSARRARGGLEPDRKASLVISNPPLPLSPRVQTPAVFALKELV